MPANPVVLLVLDGWGISSKKEVNVIASANAPVYRKLLAECSHTELQAAGEAVGLPDGQIGNPEVCHLNLGAGRVVYQDSTRISKAIRDGDFFKNPVLISAIESAKVPGRCLHLMGLLSNEGVHSCLDHIFAMVEMAESLGAQDVFFHAFLDERKTSSPSALEFITSLEEHFKKTGIGKIATISGRYYAMDYEKRWERVQKAYEAIVLGEGIRSFSAAAAIKASYDYGKTDEFMIPAVIVDPSTNLPVAQINNEDSLIFCNFLPDGASQITRAITDPTFKEFEREVTPRLSMFVCLTTYDETFNLPVAFTPVRLTNILGEVLSSRGVRQFRVAETERYAHVTSFFNGGKEPSFLGEDRALVPSRDLATYNQEPEMSARVVTAKLVGAILSREYEFILANLANPNIVRHTGVLEAAMKAIDVLDEGPVEEAWKAAETKEAIKAIELLDEYLGQILQAAAETGARVLITADHDNLDSMADPSTRQSHTTYPVPLIVFGAKVTLRSGGLLADVAPTILDLLNIDKPDDMTGQSLIDADSKAEKSSGKALQLNEREVNILLKACKKYRQHLPNYIASMRDEIEEVDDLINKLSQN